MSFHLFWLFFKKNKVVLFIFIGITVFYSSIINIMATSDMMLESMSFLNIALETGSLSEGEIALIIISAVYFGMINFIFMLVYYVILINNLINKPIEQQTLGSILASGISRKTYITTSFIYLVSSLLMLHLLLLIINTLLLLQYGNVNIGIFMYLCLLSFITSLMVAAISFFCAVVFSGNRITKLLFSGIPVLFAMFMMLGQYLNIFTNLTPFSWNDYGQISLEGIGNSWIFLICFIFGSLALFICSNFLFRQKPLII